MHDPHTISPEILGGRPVFKGTRVPVESMFDYLEGGISLDEFLYDVPSVTREQALRVLVRKGRPAFRRARPMAETGVSFSGAFRLLFSICRDSGTCLAGRT